MARARYVITASDVNHALACLRWRLGSQTLLLRTALSNRKAIEHLEAITSMKPLEARAESLHQWCLDHLEESEWGPLKSAIRKRRQRKKNLGQTESITISKRSHELLKKVAKRDNVTFSEALERTLAKALGMKAK